MSKLLGCTQRSTRYSSNLGSSRSHCCQHFKDSTGIASSHPSFILQRSWSMTLAGSKKGPANPKGSYTELFRDKIPRRVGGFSLTLTLNCNVSDCTSQLSPRARYRHSFKIQILHRFGSLTLWDGFSNQFGVGKPFGEPEASLGE